jgi:hypothetical protein
MKLPNRVTQAFDGSPTPLYQYLPCGNRATFDVDSGISYRCDQCGTVVGSIAQPRECVEEAKKYNVLKALGSKVYWDYEQGCEVVPN